MIDLDKYRKLAGTYQVNSSQDNAINNFVYQSNKIWDNTLSTYDLLAPSKRGDDIKLTNSDGVLLDSRGVFNYNKEFTKAKMAEGQERCFLQKDSASIGDYIEKIRTNEIYLIEYINRDKFNFIDSFVRKINAYTNYIDANGIIQSIPCIYRVSSKFSTNTEENKHIEILDGDASVRLQSNTHTREIKIGDKFIFSKTESYSVKNIYTELEEGIITLKMKQYEINKDLDKEIDYQGKKIWIANYVNRPKFTINFNTQDSEFQIGEDITLDYTLLDNEGNISDKPVIFSSSDDNIVSITNNIATAVSLGSVIIKVEMENNSDIYDEITLEVVNTPIENISYEINPDVSVLLRQQSQNFDIVKKNNGVVESETFTISVDSSSTVIEDYDFNVINSNSFNIVNNGTSGSLVIKIIPDSKPSDIFTKSFELKNSFW